MRLLAALAMAACMTSCAAQPSGEPRAVSQTRDPAIDGKAYLLSEADFRTVLALVRADNAHSHPWLSIRRMHVISATHVQLYCRDLRGSFYPQTAGDDWVCQVERVSTSWRLISCNPIMIITESGLTNRCSQPLAVPMSSFQMTSILNSTAKLAAASGG
jgi:hypothetical protein